MEKIFNLTSTFKAQAGEDGSVMIRGMASTADFDRAGDSISAEAWTKGGLKNFEKNPIILFNHDYDRPIGRATGMKAGPHGLELECKISKSAPGNVAELVKDGVLGAFSVGFRVKDADYIKETDGLMIKDAELFEVSVVSVPCNQAATFSLAKSFNSMDEYEEFKKTFTNRVDLAGQTLAKDEVNTSSVASDTPEKADLSAQQEIKMSEVNTPEIDLEAFAKKVAEQTAANIAMKQAEQKAAEKADQEKAAAEVAAKQAQEEQVKSAVVTAVETGAERLQADLEAKLAEKDADFNATLEAFKKELSEKNDELAKMRDSKRTFSDRTSTNDLSKWGKDFMQAHILGVVTGKGMNTAFGQSVQQKAGIDYASNAGDIDQEVSRQIEKEVTLNLRTAGLFREIQVNGAATVLPIQPDVEPATFQTGAAAAGNLENRGASNSTYQPAQVILNAYRLISQTFMDNHVDEEVLVNLMPMLVESVARAHARAVDNAIINGSGSITGLDGYATASSVAPSISGNAVLTAANLLTARKAMGKYGINPSDVAYIISQARYYELIEDSGFADITDVGSDIATKLTGAIGAVYGSPVIVSDSFAAEANGIPCAFAVNTRNYAIPRLRGVAVETDYEVGNQRRVIVATQSLGFEELVADTAGNRSAVKIDLAT
jgi:HK97 family phage prohead protease/HK97 family phage major capsid protein